MPTVEGLELAYALHELPAGSFGFRRWRWELWHGASLVAAGWRVSRPDAERALRTYAARFAHRLFGLKAPDPARATVVEGGFRPGASVRVDSGSVRCVLVPRVLEDQLGRAARLAS